MVDAGGRPGRALGSATWTELEGSSNLVLLVPVGSCEQHGPHLPLDTDTTVAVAVAEAVAEQRSDVLVAPAVAIGASGEHAAFPGTLSVGTDVLATVLVELARSALPPDRSGPFGAVVLVNGHGGNVEAVTRAVDLLQAEGRPVSAWSPRIAGGDAHAGRTETSILLELAPETVRAQRPLGETAPMGQLSARLRVEGVRAVSPSGVLGDARGAEAEEGRRILDALVEDLAAHVRGLTDAE